MKRIIIGLVVAIILLINTIAQESSITFEVEKIVKSSAQITYLDEICSEISLQVIQ